MGLRGGDWMGFGLTKELNPVLLCDKCKCVVENFSKTFIVWNILDLEDDDSGIVDSLLMHENCLSEMLYEFSETDMVEGDLQTITIADYITKLLKRHPLELKIMILDDYTKGKKYEH